jgi:hypothetical protein
MAVLHQINNVTYPSITTSPLTIGQVYTSSGTGTANWTTPSTQFNSSTGKAIMTVPNGKDEVVLEKDATLTIKGKVVINDIDLEELTMMETQVTIIRKNSPDVIEVYFKDEKQGIYCVEHKREDMIDVHHKRCLTINCDIRGNKKYEGYCLFCFINLYFMLCNQQCTHKP